MKLDLLNDYFQKTLNPNGMIFSDSRANGLQIRGKDEVQKVAFGVDASLEFFKTAYEWGADALFVHHGIGFDLLENSIPDKVLHDRMKFLFMTNISLFGFHFLMDYHMEIGNNAQILSKIGQNPDFPFGFFEGQNWGWGSHFESPQHINFLFEVFGKLFLGNAKILKFGKENISSIGVITGDGSSTILEAYEKGIDLVVTGEIKEPTQERCRELRINLIWGGHYVTETFGVKALASKLQDDLKIETKFFDIPNPI